MLYTCVFERVLENPPVVEEPFSNCCGAAIAVWFKKSCVSNYR